MTAKRRRMNKLDERDELRQESSRPVEPAAPETQADRPAPSLAARDPQTLLALQRAVGNQAVGRLLGRSGPGRPLEPAARQDMEAALDGDFGEVRVHADAASEQALEGLGAEAATVGAEVLMSPQDYPPRTPHGRELVAHELAHVAQRGGQMPVDGVEGITQPDAPAEREARSVAGAVMTGQGVERPRRTLAPGLLARQEAPAGEAGTAVREAPALTPQEQSLADLYWQRRRADPAWAAQFHAVVDQRFWERTGYKVGRQLEPALPEDRPYIRIWLQVRDEVMAEQLAQGGPPSAGAAEEPIGEEEVELVEIEVTEITFEESEVEPIESELNGDKIHDALVLMRRGPSLVERNTAEVIDSGRLKARYIEDCPVDPQSDDLLDGWGYDKTQFIVRRHPDTDEQMIVQRNADGIRSGDYIFASRASTTERVKTVLVHETNHALRAEAGSTEEAASFERYKDEFQAYWVAEFANVADLDERARRIKQHILGGYPLLQAAYNKDADFKRQVDGHTRPDANVLNSPRWAGVERGVAGWGTDEEEIYRNIRAMSPEERTALRNDANFMAIFRDDLDDDELQKAILLLENHSEHVVACLDAMTGMGTDEEAIYTHLQQMSAEEKARLRNNQWFLDRLRDELSGDELDRALALLGLGGG